MNSCASRWKNSRATTQPWGIWPSPGGLPAATRTAARNAAVSVAVGDSARTPAFVGGWLILREVERVRVDSYVQRLRDEPGVVVTGAERRSGKWHVSGLRDPLAADPAEVLAAVESGSQACRRPLGVLSGADPAIVLRRLSASLNPPPGVSLSLDGDTIRATGSAPQHWVEQAKALIAAMPAGSPKVDLTALTDIQDPTFVRLRDAIQAHVINFDSNAPRPAPGQDPVLDALAAEFRELITRGQRAWFLRARDDRRPRGRHR